MVVEIAGRSGVVVDDQGDVGLEWTLLLVAACDELSECFGGEPVAVVGPVHELGVTGLFAGGDVGGDLCVDRSEDLVGEFGMKGVAAFDHAGCHVRFAGQERVATLALVAFDALVAFEVTDPITARAPELLG